MPNGVIESEKNIKIYDDHFERFFSLNFKMLIPMAVQ